MINATCAVPATIPVGNFALSKNVQASYDGSGAVFRLLRLTTFGPALMNLGYHSYSGLFRPINGILNLETAQRRLVHKAIDLLQLQPGQKLLDVACGRGKSSFIAHCLHPSADILGMDLLTENISVAQSLFGNAPNLSYTLGNAMALDVPDNSCDRVMCIEAAFHFPCRHRFLQEAFRVLKPGGRLVLVDFAWRSEDSRQTVSKPEMDLVREIWQFEDFSTQDEYQAKALESGFHAVEIHDWTRPVTKSFQNIFEGIVWLGSCGWGRRLIEHYNPLLKILSERDWIDLRAARDAHAHVQSRSKYLAFVFHKPEATQLRVI